MKYAIQVKELTKNIGQQTILNKVSINVKSGEIYGFLGANGAGKTSLMKLLYQIMIPDSGSIMLLGETISRGSNKVFSNIGSIIETPVFYGDFDARHNLYLHAQYMGTGMNQIEEALTLFDLSDTKNKPVKTFSLGMRQRLSLARAILTKPKLLVLDEPMNGLDPQGINSIRKLLMRINKEHKTTIFLSSHILSELEKMADTIGVIDKGNMLDEISLEELRDKEISLENYYLGLLKGGKHNEKVN